MTLRAIKVQGNKEVGPLLSICKALNDLKEIKRFAGAFTPVKPDRRVSFELAIIIIGRKSW
jgi:hypothetical protein